MYNNGHGIYNSTARSFYNVNPVFNPEDNGRASPQFPTQHVPIYNPAMTLEHMHTQAQASRDYLEKGGIVNYATRGMHAENYTLLESQARAKRYGSLMGGLSTASTALGVVGGLFASTGVGLGIGAGAMYISNELDSAQEYYKSYSDRMSRLGGIKNAFAGNYNIVNPATGVMSNQAANRFADMMLSQSKGSGFSEQDMYSVHTMANRSGLMQGHEGSLGEITTRVSALAKMTKQIMDLGQGINQTQAMEIQKLSQTMEVDLDKFKNLNISEKLISAAKLTNKTIAATTAVLESNAAQSAQLGLGAQAGVESALYHSRFAAPQFGQLTSKQQGAVGGSQEAYIQNLVNAQLKFASRNANTLAMGAYYIDPNTGQFKIDTNEVYEMAHGGLDPTQEYKRGMQILNKENRKKLKTAGINQNLVSNLLQENLGTLGKEAMGEVSSDLQTAMTIKEIVRTAADNGMSFNQAAAHLGYSQQEISSLKTFSQNYGKGADRSREVDRLSYLEELSARNANSTFVHSSQVKKDAKKGAAARRANLDATIDSMKADTAREEAVGIYGGRRRTYTEDQINAVLSGGYSSIIDGTDAREKRTGSHRDGVYLGIAQKDLYTSGFHTKFNLGSQERDALGFKRSIYETVAGKEVLAKLYASDFYGEGTDVAKEDSFGNDTRIMTRLAEGSYFSTNDLNRSFNARDTVTRALNEIYGRNSDDLDKNLELVSNPEMRKRLKDLARGDESGDLTGDTSTDLSNALTSLQVSEVAKFSRTGRRLRTAGSRRNMLSTVQGDEANRRVNESALALQNVIQQGVDSSSNILATDNSNLSVAQSRRAMAQAIFKSGKSGFKSIGEVEENLDAILARAYESGGQNVRKTLDKTFSVAESALSLLGEERTIYEASTEIGEYTTSKFIKGSHSPAHHTSDRYVHKKHSMTLSGLVLGSPDLEDGKESSKLITDKAVTLTNAVQKLSENEKYSSPGVAQNKVSDLIHEAANYIIKNSGVFTSFDNLFEMFLSENGEKKKLLAELGSEHAATIKRFIRDRVNASETQDYVTKTTKEEFREMFGSVLAVGKKEINKQAVESFVAGSTTVKGMFGKGRTDKEYSERLIDVFQQLNTKTTFGETSKFLSKTGGVDTNAILGALGFNLTEVTDEDAAGLRQIAATAFGSGTFDESNRKKFGELLKKRIQQGKMKSVGDTPNLTNADAIQSAVTAMTTLQKATAELLTALATNNKGKLEAVATTLQGLQSKK